MFAPGCKHFGTEVSEWCRSLTRVGTAQCLSNRLAPSPTEASSFQACTALSHINLGMPEPDAAHPNRCLPDCCFLEAGIVALVLPTDFNRIGSTACASRQQLQAFDPSQTEDHGIRSLPQMYLSTGGFHSTIPALHGAMRLCRLHAISSNVQTRKK